MASPFETCGVLNVTMGKASTKRSGDSFEESGRLFMVVDPKGWAHHFGIPGVGLLPPEEINGELESMGVKVRVDFRGRPYELED